MEYLIYIIALGVQERESRKMGSKGKYMGKQLRTSQWIWWSVRHQQIKEKTQNVSKVHQNW